MLRKIGKNRCSKTKKARFHGRLESAVQQLLDDILELLPDVGGNNGRRSFVCTQSVIITRMSYGNTHEVLVFVYGSQHSCKEEEKLHIVVRAFPRLQKVHAFLRAQRPVQVLPASV